MPQLVSIETSGNQAFIFHSNKLRENLGASELVWQVSQFGAGLAERKIRVENGRLIGADWLRGEQEIVGASDIIVQVNQLNDLLNTSSAETIVAASGKLLVRFNGSDRGPEFETASQFVRCVTLWATIFAPSLVVRGAIAELIDESADGFQNTLHELHHRQVNLAARLPFADLRFQRLPCVTDCYTTQFPAERICDVGGGEQRPLSAVAIAKRVAAERGRTRLSRIARGQNLQIQLPNSLDDLDKIEQVRWLAVVHIDGNGLGQLFWNFQSIANPKDASDYAAKLRNFSNALDAVTQSAFQAAALHVWNAWCRRGQQNQVLPVVPLVLGGDDLTVVMDGTLAIEFAREFLQKFEVFSAANPMIADFAQRRPDCPSNFLAACAGIAIVKPHFPFYDAYKLCDQLLSRAKQVKQQCAGVAVSALDFHVLRDSSNADLRRITESLCVTSQVKGAETVKELYVRPVVVTPPERYATLNVGGKQWTDAHHWERLCECVAALRKPLRAGEPQKLLSGTFAHRLRESLFVDGRDRQLIALEKRRRNMTALNCFLSGSSGNESIFELVPSSPPANRFHTRYLDAMEIEPFWPDEQVTPQPTVAEEVAQ